ncbi:MAG TPA: pyridoxamine 5'-phosphate oxidase family protein [Stenotrophomonas sp.]|nr:pyridoxamine 5'-phosphate oxidase family protein [Stenotrophomonas sp.]
MADDRELEQKFWKTLKADRTVMLGLVAENGHAQPMTALIEGDEGGPIWFFTARDNDLVAALRDTGAQASLQLVGKGHDVFASASGTLREQTDRDMVERLWNPFIAAWYTGKDDPKLVLLRFDPAQAQVWLNENSLWAGVKLLLGVDPKRDYADKVGDVQL